jgi:hypothetical protein
VQKASEHQPVLSEKASVCFCASSVQDLVLLGQQNLGAEISSEVVRLKLEFVTKVCSTNNSTGLDPQLHSWVAHYCQAAAEVLGEDFAVGRVTKPAVVEAARCVGV